MNRKKIQKQIIVKNNQSLIIFYSVHKTIFGQCLVASTDAGVRAVLFGDTQTELLADLKLRWPHSVCVKKIMPTHTDVVSYINGKTTVHHSVLDIQGTAFQKKVWKKLLGIAKGETVQYGHIAEKLGDRKLARAVGSAVGANHLGYIIPCHRVVPVSGAIGEYRWGSHRKQKMLEVEMKK